MAEDLLLELAKTGPIGIILLWFMIRNERVVCALTDAVKEMRKSQNLTSKTLVVLSEAIGSSNGVKVGAVVESMRTGLKNEIDKELET